MPKIWGIIKNLFGADQECMNGTHNCQKIADTVKLAIDGELTEDQEKQLLADVEACPKCLEYLDIEKSFKQFLRQKVAKKKVNPELIKSIRLQISQLEA